MQASSKKSMTKLVIKSWSRSWPTVIRAVVAAAGIHPRSATAAANRRAQAGALARLVCSVVSWAMRCSSFGPQRFDPVTRGVGLLYHHLERRFSDQRGVALMRRQVVWY